MTSSTQKLDRSLAQGIAWTSAIRWSSQIVSWAATVVLARVLTPTDYGLVGMAMIYVGLAQIVSEGGVSAAIVQKRSMSEPEVAELHGLAVMIGVLLLVFTLVIAAPLAWFFQEPQVYPVVLVLSSVFVIRGIQVVPRALLARDLDFRRLAYVDGLETFSLTVVTVAFAIGHYGYWALALGGVASSVVTTVLAVWWRPHRVRLPRTVAGIRDSVVFAWQVVTSQVAWYAYSNADFAVVGRVLGKAVLGAYSFAWTIASIPVDRVSGMVTRVTPAFFAAVQDDKPALRRYLLNLTEALALVTLPACIGLALVAPELVQVALGDAWTAAIMPLRLLAIYAAFRSVITPAPQILIATGHSRQSMYFSLLSLLVLPPAFWFATRWGAPGVAMVWILVYPIIAIGLFLQYAFRLIGMSARSYLGALAPAAAATTLMALVVMMTRRTMPAHWTPLELLLAQVLVGAVVYTAIVYAIRGTKLRALRTLLRSSDEPGTEGLSHDSGPPYAGDRLLLISYHFPPDPAVGALRWRKLVRHAAERGWGVDVIARDPGSLPIADAMALADLPPGVRVYGVPLNPPPIERPMEALWRGISSLGPRRKVTERRATPRSESRHREDIHWLPRSLRDLVRVYFAWLEHSRHARWARDAARIALTVRDHRHRAIITCGPPHEVHKAGVIVAKKTGLRLITDFRDPWSLIERMPEHVASPVGLTLASRAERRVIEHASLVVANTPAFRNAMRTRYPLARERIIAVPNGFDDDPVPPTRPNRRFTLAYAGTVYLDRNPRGLLRAAARVVRELGLSPAEFGVEFMGIVQAFDFIPLHAIAAEEGMNGYLTLHPGGARAAAMEFLARAHVLVVLPQDSAFAIPAKVFDYARFDAWVMALADTGSATELLLQGTTADVVRPDDIDAMTEVIRSHYLQHLRGETGRRLSHDVRLSRRHQAGILFDELEAVVGRPTPEASASPRVPALTPLAT